MTCPFKIKVHSFVDLITNSSTVIYTYSGGSLSSVKALVNEMLKVFESDKTFDDIFYADVFLDDDYRYTESDSFPNSDISWEERSKYIADTKLQILKGEIDPPTWIKEADDSENYNGYSTSLELYPKDDKYKSLANKIINFLYSTSHESNYDG